MTGWCVCVGWRQPLRICMRLGLDLHCVLLCPLYWFRLSDLTGVVSSEKNGSLQKENTIQNWYLTGGELRLKNATFRVSVFCFFKNERRNEQSNAKKPSKFSSLLQGLCLRAVLCAAVCSRRAGLPLFLEKVFFVFGSRDKHTESLGFRLSDFEGLILIWLNFVNWITRDTINDCQTSVT